MGKGAFVNSRGRGMLCGILLLLIADPPAIAGQELVTPDSPPVAADPSWVPDWVTPGFDNFALVPDWLSPLGSPDRTAVPEPWEWQLMPEGLLYKSYIAGPHEPRLSTAVLGDLGGQTVWESSLGGRMGIARFGTVRGLQPEGFQIDVEGAAFVRLLPEQERDVGAVDFRAGVPLTYRQGQWQAKFGYYHISSHLGDEFLLKNPGFDRLNYVRDAFVLGVGYFPIPAVRVYAEVGWAAIFTSGGAEPWEFQTGIEYDSLRPTGIRGEPFFAANLHLRQEVDWGGSANVLAGWQWRGKRSDHVFRAFFQFYNGKDIQYSFLQENVQYLGAGIRYDF
jgi:hypothetical protein